MILNVPLITDGVDWSNAVSGTIYMSQESSYRRATTTVTFPEPGEYLIFAVGHTVRNANSASAYYAVVSAPEGSGCTVQSLGTGKHKITVPTEEDTVTIVYSRSSVSTGLFGFQLIAGPGRAGRSTTHSTTP